MTVHDFVKAFLIEAFITAHNFDVICLPETFLDSKMPHNQENINIKGYSLLRGDYRNIKPNGVCMYLKESSPLIRQSGLSNTEEYITAV